MREDNPVRLVDGLHAGSPAPAQQRLLLSRLLHGSLCHGAPKSRLAGMVLVLGATGAAVTMALQTARHLGAGKIIAVVNLRCTCYGSQRKIAAPATVNRDLYFLLSKIDKKPGIKNRVRRR